MKDKPVKAPQPKYELSADQLKAQLDEDLSELKREAEAYDAGHYAAAGALAVRLFTLLHDKPKKGNSGVSRATRAGVKPAFMPDLRIHSLMENPFLHGPLCVVAERLMGASGFVPLLGKRTPGSVLATLPFDEWWTAPVFRDALGNTLSRGTIINEMRDRQIAHADGSLMAEYGAVLYEGMFAVEQQAPEEMAGDPNVFRTIVRHATNEVLLAMDTNYAGCVPEVAGRLFAPRVLLQLAEWKNGAADGVAIPNSIKFPVVVHLTSNEAMANEWKLHRGEAKVPPGLPEMADRSWLRRDIRISAAFSNANFVPITRTHADCSLDQRSGAFVVRVVVRTGEAAM